MKHIKAFKGKNLHSVYTHCYECKMWGVNFPNDDVCGNCNSTDTMTYYDSETIKKQLREVASKAFDAARFITITNYEDFNEDGWPASDYTYSTFEDYLKSLDIKD